MIVGKKDEDVSPCKRTLRSKNVVFRWKEMCVVCGEKIGIVEDKKKVATFIVGVKLMEACFARSFDQWAIEVKVRLDSCIHLPT